MGSSASTDGHAPVPANSPAQTSTPLTSPHGRQSSLHNNPRSVNSAAPRQPKRTNTSPQPQQAPTPPLPPQRNLKSHGARAESPADPPRHIAAMSRLSSARLGHDDGATQSSGGRPSSRFSSGHLRPVSTSHSSSAEAHKAAQQSSQGRHSRHTHHPKPLQSPTPSQQRQPRSTNSISAQLSGSAGASSGSKQQGNASTPAMASVLTHPSSLSKEPTEHRDMQRRLSAQATSCNYSPGTAALTSHNLATPSPPRLSQQRSSGHSSAHHTPIRNSSLPVQQPTCDLAVRRPTGNGSNHSANHYSHQNDFDIDSGNEGSDAVGGGDNTLYVTTSSVVTPPRQAHPAKSPGDPVSTLVTTSAFAGHTYLRQKGRSSSLVSLADTPDRICTPSSPITDLSDRLETGSPDFTGFALPRQSRPSSACDLLGAPRTSSGRLDNAQQNGLAMFFNRPRECAACKSTAVAFACEVCDDFFLCEDCRFDVEALRAIHDPTHAMLSIQENHCGSSRTFGNDSIFSLSGEGGVSSIFNPPCSKCQRAIDDTEPVYRCDQCDYVLCQVCYFKTSDQSSENNGDIAEDDEAHPHEHVLKRFQRRTRSGSVHEGTVVSKTRNSDGNRVINNYVVVRLLGKGSYAKVKLVQHIRTQELFALKILKRQKKGTSFGMSLGRSRMRLASTGMSEDDLLREIAVMKCIDHPNVLKLKEVIEDVEAQKVYAIMEYCENGPVHVLDSPALPLDVVRRYGADILRGLLHLHSEYLYHRDVKPANCLVNHEQVAKIADFGTCNSQIRTKSSEGTIAFSCPEQIRGEKVSGDVVDSWAFALTLYEMAYGTLPVSTTSMAQLRNALKGDEPLFIPPDNDPQLRDLLSKMLEKDLSKRIQLAGAARHPFFESFRIDHRGTPSSSVTPDANNSNAAPATATAPAPAPPPQQQQALSELYDKALGSVHRGKNLKDAFHGVRALRRIRRKEAETARYTRSSDTGGGGILGGEDEYDLSYYFEDDDDEADYEYEEEAEEKDATADGVLQYNTMPARAGAPLDSVRYDYGYCDSGSYTESRDDASKSATPRIFSTSRNTTDNPNAAYSYSNDTHSADGNPANALGNDKMLVKVAEDAAAVEAATQAVEEVVKQQLASNESKADVAYVSLFAKRAREPLNQLAGCVSDLRLNHNHLTTIQGLQLSTFSMLKEIAITFNRLSTFPEEVLQAPRLVRLDLSHNRITSIPGTLVTHAPFLERLNLHHNGISFVGTTTIPITADTSAPSLPPPPPPPVVSRIARKPLTGEGANGSRRTSSTRTVSVLAAPCLRHVRLSGNALESLPACLESTHHLELVLDAIPSLMEQWEAHTQSLSRPSDSFTQRLPTNSTKGSASTRIFSKAGTRGSDASATSPHTNTAALANSTSLANCSRSISSSLPLTKLPAVIVWDDSFPVRIPDVEPAVWLAVNNMAVYRVQTLRTCRTRRVVLCQCAHPRFPNGVFTSAELEGYFAELTKAIQQRREVRMQRIDDNNLNNFSFDNSVSPATQVNAAHSALPPVVGRAARSYVESYFFVTDDETAEDGGYHSLVEYVNDALEAKEPLMVVVVSNSNKAAVRTNIVAALSTCLTQLRGKEADDINEQAELVMHTMRSLYA